MEYSLDTIVTLINRKEPLPTGFSRALHTVVDLALNRGIYTLSVDELYRQLKLKLAPQDQVGSEGFVVSESLYKVISILDRAGIGMVPISVPSTLSIYNTVYLLKKPDLSVDQDVALIMRLAQAQNRPANYTNAQIDSLQLAQVKLRNYNILLRVFENLGAAQTQALDANQRTVLNKIISQMVLPHEGERYLRSLYSYACDYGSFLYHYTNPKYVVKPLNGKDQEEVIDIIARTIAPSHLRIKVPEDFPWKQFLENRYSDYCPQVFELSSTDSAIKIPVNERPLSSLSLAQKRNRLKKQLAGMLNALQTPPAAGVERFSEKAVAATAALNLTEDDETEASSEADGKKGSKAKAGTKRNSVTRDADAVAAAATSKGASVIAGIDFSGYDAAMRLELLHSRLGFSADFMRRICECTMVEDPRFVDDLKHLQQQLVKDEAIRLMLPNFKQSRLMLYLPPRENTAVGGMPRDAAAPAMAAMGLTADAAMGATADATTAATGVAVGVAAGSRADAEADAAAEAGKDGPSVAVAVDETEKRYASAVRATVVPVVNAAHAANAASEAEGLDGLAARDEDEDAPDDLSALGQGAPNAQGAIDPQYFAPEERSKSERGDKGEKGEKDKNKARQSAQERQTKLYGGQSFHVVVYTWERLTHLYHNYLCWADDALHLQPNVNSDYYSHLVQFVQRPASQMARLDRVNCFEFILRKMFAPNQEASAANSAGHGDDADYLHVFELESRNNFILLNALPVPFLFYHGLYYFDKYLENPSTHFGNELFYLHLLEKEPYALNMYLSRICQKYGSRLVDIPEEFFTLIALNVLLFPQMALEQESLGLLKYLFKHSVHSSFLYKVVTLRILAHRLYRLVQEDEQLHDVRLQLQPISQGWVQSLESEDSSYDGEELLSRFSSQDPQLREELYGAICKLLPARLTDDSESRAFVKRFVQEFCAQPWMFYQKVAPELLEQMLKELQTEADAQAGDAGAQAGGAAATAEAAAKTAVEDGETQSADGEAQAVRDGDASAAAYGESEGEGDSEGEAADADVDAVSMDDDDDPFGEKLPRFKIAGREHATTAKAAVVPAVGASYFLRQAQKDPQSGSGPLLGTGGAYAQVAPASKKPKAVRSGAGVGGVVGGGSVGGVVGAGAGGGESEALGAGTGAGAGVTEWEASLQAMISEIKNLNANTKAKLLTKMSEQNATMVERNDTSQLVLGELLSTLQQQCAQLNHNHSLMASLLEEARKGQMSMGNQSEELDDARSQGSRGASAAAANATAMAGAGAVNVSEQGRSPLTLLNNLLATALIAVLETFGGLRLLQKSNAAAAGSPRQRQREQGQRQRLSSFYIEPPEHSFGKNSPFNDEFLGPLYTTYVVPVLKRLLYKDQRYLYAFSQLLPLKKLCEDLSNKIEYDFIRDYNLDGVAYNLCIIDSFVYDAQEPRYEKLRNFFLRADDAYHLGFAAGIEVAQMIELSTLLRRNLHLQIVPLFYPNASEDNFSCLRPRVSHIRVLAIPEYFQRIPQEEYDNVLYSLYCAYMILEIIYALLPVGEKEGLITLLVQEISNIHKFQRYTDSVLFTYEYLDCATQIIELEGPLKSEQLLDSKLKLDVALMGNRGVKRLKYFLTMAFSFELQHSFVSEMVINYYNELLLRLHCLDDNKQASGSPMDRLYENYIEGRGPQRISRLELDMNKIQAKLKESEQVQNVISKLREQEQMQEQASAQAAAQAAAQDASLGGVSASASGAMATANGSAATANGCASDSGATATNGVGGVKGTGIGSGKGKSKAKGKGVAAMAANAANEADSVGTMAVGAGAGSGANATTARANAKEEKDAKADAYLAQASRSELKFIAGALQGAEAMAKRDALHADGQKGAIAEATARAQNSNAHTTDEFGQVVSKSTHPINSKLSATAREVIEAIAIQGTDAMVYREFNGICVSHGMISGNYCIELLNDYCYEVYDEPVLELEGVGDNAIVYITTEILQDMYQHCLNLKKG